MRPRGRRSAGFASPEALVGVAVGCLVLTLGLAAASGLVGLAHRVVDRSFRLTAARWALARMEREVRRAGIGVSGPTDEPVEFFTNWALAVRADLDRDEPGLDADPEADLVRAGTPPATANDEVVVFLRRDAKGGGGERVSFQADVDGTDRLARSDGALLARRDGSVEWVDAGPCAAPGAGGAGTLYRVTFVHDARHFGTGRFRVVEPLADGIAAMTVQALDGRGRPLETCGGADDAKGLRCRAAIRQVEIELVVELAGGERESLSRRFALPAEVIR